MAYRMALECFDRALQLMKSEYRFFAPVVLKGKGTFTDTDSIRYQEINSISEICFDKKSNFSFKEVLLPITQTLFYFTEDNWSEPAVDDKKLLIFLRSCDIHALKRLDDIYLRNDLEDPYYKVFREKARFCLMECGQGFENCFCVSMKTNITDEYDLLVRLKDNCALVEVKDDTLPFSSQEELQLEPNYPMKNFISIDLPKKLTQDFAGSPFWHEYSARCIGCGRCNFVCPTCTCFSMQDIFYKDNPNAGERRRVWASCMVDGYTDMAGGHQFRKTQGDRMRFRVMHKVYDYQKRFGRHMCVGCGRCDDACPEYISFSNCLNKLSMAEVKDQ